MKRLYWKARKIPFRSVLAVCVVTLASVAAVEICPRRTPRPGLERKLAAARLANEAIHEIKRERLRRGHVFNPAFDPAQTGLIGDDLTPVTSLAGHLGSKQTTVNPNFAAVIVEMLMQAGVGPGDTVAVGYSGSMPAMNLNLCAALETIGAKPIVVVSASSSQYGANHPEFLWIDMQRHLHDRGLISFRSVAASFGGYEDLALGATEEARGLLAASIRRNGLPLIVHESFTEAVDQRMAIYREHAGSRPIKAYVNVGGGTVSVGRSVGKKLYQPGLNLTATDEAMGLDSVMTRFMREGTPVIHLVEISHLARTYGLPYAPTELPAVGEGDVYRDTGPNRWLAGVGLLLVATMLRLGSREGESHKPSKPRGGGPGRVPTPHLLMPRTRLPYYDGS
ncbi:MAG: poly-gamma-glutamate system protein [Planctomycetaceae bacterium]